MDAHKPVTFPWRIALTELRFSYVSVVVPQEGQAGNISIHTVCRFGNTFYEQTDVIISLKLWMSIEWKIYTRLNLCEVF